MTIKHTWWSHLFLRMMEVIILGNAWSSISYLYLVINNHRYFVVRFVVRFGEVWRWWLWIWWSTLLICITRDEWIACSMDRILRWWFIHWPKNYSLGVCNETISSHSSVRLFKHYWAEWIQSDKKRTPVLIRMLRKILVLDFNHLSKIIMSLLKL